MRYLLNILLLLMLAVPVPVHSASPPEHVLGDITMPRKGPDTTDFMPQAVFSHWKHRTRFKCYACHDEIFQMKIGADNIVMDDIQAGQYCAVCHDGKNAFAVGFDTCERCHMAPVSGK